MSEILRRHKSENCPDCELDNVIKTIKIEFPSFKIVQKSDSLLMKVINIVLKALSLGKMTTFMDHYVTTVRSTVYVPSNWATRTPYAKSSILRHERIHMVQTFRIGWLLFALGYLFFPLPIGFAWGRMRFEREAYEESMYSQYQYYGIEVLRNQQVRESMIRNFIGPAYLWMWPFRSKVEHWYDGMVSAIEKAHDEEKG